MSDYKKVVDLMESYYTARERKINEIIKNNNNSTDTKNKITTQQSRFLNYLMKNSDKKITPGILAREFNITGATVSGLIQRMKKNNWIGYRKNPKDTRSKFLILSTNGKEFAESMENELAEFNEEALSVLSEDEREAFISYLDRIVTQQTAEKK